MVREKINRVPTYGDGPAESTVTVRVTREGERRIRLRRANREKSTPQDVVHDLFERVVRTQADAPPPPEFVDVEPGTHALAIREGTVFTLRMVGTDEERGRQQPASALGAKGFKPEQVGMFVGWSLVPPETR